MDSVNPGKAAFTCPQPVHTMVSLPMVPDSKAERIELVPESSSKTREYSHDEWELQRGHITNLYVTDKKTLPQVMDLMESRYGFVASQRQYKRRFAKWGLDTKNIRDQDMRLALAKDLKRKREGKDTEFEINGRLLPRQKMQRFLVRKELSEEDVMRSDAPTPPHVTYHTPRPVEDDDVTNTLVSISLGKDEVMADAYATHGEGTENLFDHWKIIGSDEQREKLASASISILPSSNELSEDTSKILDRNEAWLERRFKARNNPELILSYARLMWIFKKRLRSSTLEKEFSIWKSYLGRRLATLCPDPYKRTWSAVPEFHHPQVLYRIKKAFYTLNNSFGGDWDAQLLSTFSIWKSGVPYLRSDLDELLLQKPLSNTPTPYSDFNRGDIREEPLHELQSISTASPFERWSQRYDISSSPNWIKSYMSPSNPLSLLTPAPIGTPWDHIPKASPRPTGSQRYGSRLVNSDNFAYDISCLLPGTRGL